MNDQDDAKLVTLTLPSQRFYWALLDVSALPARRRRDRASLGFLFENTLPAAIEQVHAVYFPASGDDRVLACGMSKDGLRSAVDSNPDVLMLKPSDLPSFVVEHGVDVQQINLLKGEFEPPRIKRSRRRLVVNAVLVLALLATIMAMGIERRIHATQGDIAQAQRARLELIKQVVSVSANNNQPPDLRLLAELRMLRQTRQRPVHEASSAIRDVTPALASLLQSWPADLHVQTESIAITPTSMTLRGLAPSSDDVQSLATALQSQDGWQLQQPEISTASKGVNATLQWKRTGMEGKR